MEPQIKNPLDEALAHFTTKETLEPTLRIVHAVLSHAWTLSTLLPDQNNDQIAADSRAFAKAIRTIELKLNSPFQPFIGRKQVEYSTPPPAARKPAPAKTSSKS